MDQIIAAERRREQAKAALDAASQGRSWEAARQASMELHEAERQLARIPRRMSAPGRPSV
jgi:hypothetical protein